MLALAGYPLGLRFRFLEPGENPPVTGLGEVVQGAWDDIDAALEFADGLDVVTYEFENVPVATARALGARLAVHPAPGALEMAQDRLAEKEAFAGLGIPTAPFRVVDSRADLGRALEALGAPAVLKTRYLGYDGKGQFVVRDRGQADAAWKALGGPPLILEGFVAFRRELSILGVRGPTGDTRFYPLVETVHEDGILRRSTCPAPDVSAETQALAEEQVRRVMERLDYVGVIAIELFDTGHGLLANELAPRVHNSGHWTQDGAECSQFENHLRAICGLPLGCTAVRGHAAMVNLLGTVPPVDRLLAVPGAHVHLYDKAPRPGRKLGHVNVVGTDFGTVRESVADIEALLTS